MLPPSFQAPTRAGATGVEPTVTSPDWVNGPVPNSVFAATWNTYVWPTESPVVFAERLVETPSLNVIHVELLASLY